MTDTIFALATAAGRSAVAVMRISGPMAANRLAAGNRSARQSAESVVARRRKAGRVRSMKL